MLDIYLPAIRQSTLPVGIYDLGEHTPIFVPTRTLAKVLTEKNVLMLKDSSGDPKRMRMALGMKQKRKGNLKLFNGNEWGCISYLETGYDGLLLGGGIMNGHIACLIMQDVHAGDTAKAKNLQKRMNRLQRDIYGGSSAKRWLSGLKQMMVEMGIFRTRKCYVEFPFTAKDQ